MVLRDKHIGNSGTFDLNYLCKVEEKVYVMDNHLAAAWCWLRETSHKNSYNLFHIDRHYDLLDGGTDLAVKEIREKNFSIKNSTLNEYTNFKRYSYKYIKYIQAFRSDNYITILNKLYPNYFEHLKFAILESKQVKNFDKKIYECHINNLTDGNFSYWIEECEKPWIINIDLDYFFSQDENSKYFQFLSDDFIIKLGQEVRKKFHRIQVITIALSANFCGGQENAKRVLEILLNTLKK